MKTRNLLFTEYLYSSVFFFFAGTLVKFEVTAGAGYLTLLVGLYWPHRALVNQCYLMFQNIEEYNSKKMVLPYTLAIAFIVISPLFLVVNLVWPFVLSLALLIILVFKEFSLNETNL